MEETVSLKWIK